MSLHPFFNWSGSKRHCLHRLSSFLPEQLDLAKHRYFEPFVGSGSVLFFLQPKTAIIGDIDPKICNAFQCMIRFKDSQRTQQFLRHMYRVKDQHAQYNDLCDKFGTLSGAMQAAAFIYIVKHVTQEKRVVKKWRGERGIDWSGLTAAARYLQHNEVKCMHADYQKTLRRAKKGDFVFLDPPYSVQKNAKQQHYINHCISATDIANIMNTLHKRGCLVMLVDTFKNTRYPGFMRHAFNACTRTTHEPRNEFIYINYKRA